MAVRRGPNASLVLTAVVDDHSEVDLGEQGGEELLQLPRVRVESHNDAGDTNFSQFGVPLPDADGYGMAVPPA